MKLGTDRRVRSVRRRRQCARRDRHRRGPRLLRRRRSLRRRRHVRSRGARRGPARRSPTARSTTAMQVRDGGGRLTLRIFECLKPVIAAVNGPAVGIGVTMQLPMDIRIASETPAIGFVFVAARHRSGGVLELVPAAPRRHHQALEWCLFRPRLPGAGSARRRPGQLGACAGRICSRGPCHRPRNHRQHRAGVGRADPPHDVAHARRRSPDGSPQGRQPRHLPARAQADANEGVISFLEKRPPSSRTRSPATCRIIFRGGRNASISERPARTGHRDPRRRRPAARDQQDGAIVSKDAAGAGTRRFHHPQPGLCEPPQGAGGAGRGHSSRDPAICRPASMAPSISFAIPWAGCLARVYIARYRPIRLGRVVMLGTPNGGSEIADRLRNIEVYRAFFGPAGQQLGTQRDAAIEALFPPVDYPVGIIAGNRSIDPVAGTMLPKPHDGRVSVANTKLEGMADHVVVRDLASLAGAEW